MRLLVGSDQILRLPKLVDGQGNRVTTATVTVSIIDRKGVVVGAPITLAHVGDGAYSGDIPASLALEPRQTYTVEAVAEASGAKRTWRQDLVAEYGGLE